MLIIKALGKLMVFISCQIKICPNYKPVAVDFISHETGGARPPTAKNYMVETPVDVHGLQDDSGCAMDHPVPEATPS